MSATKGLHVLAAAAALMMLSACAGLKFQQPAKGLEFALVKNIEEVLKIALDVD